MQTWTVAVVDDEHEMLLIMLTFIFMHCMIMTWHDTKLNSYIYKTGRFDLPIRILVLSNTTGLETNPYMRTVV